MRPFLICIHDATPAYARETRSMIRELAPLVGRRLSFGVVPDWHGKWPLTAHPDYCRLLDENVEELLLHGYCHRRARGHSPLSWLAESSDEMSGLDPHGTRRAIERGQRVFTDAFGAPSAGFLAPAWQAAHVQPGDGNSPGVEYVVGFFSVESSAGRRIPLSTFTWDCGRWASLGHIGHGIGRLLQSLGAGVPALAIHPRDLERGFWPGILRQVRDLLERGYEPSTSARLLEAHDAEVAV
jgi:hypothetical protein